VAYVLGSVLVLGVVLYVRITVSLNIQVFTASSWKVGKSFYIDRPKMVFELIGYRNSHVNVNRKLR